MGKGSSASVKQRCAVHERRNESLVFNVFASTNTHTHTHMASATKEHMHIYVEVNGTHA